MSVGVLPAIERLRRMALVRPLGVCAAVEREAERHRRVALTGIAAALAKTVSVGTGLITVPMTLNYLGPERFGLWMTISSTIAVLGFADFGIGNGLMNSISRAYGKDDDEAVARYIASGVALLGAIALVLGVVFLIAYPAIPWHRLFNVSSESAARESGPAMAAFFACFALGLPLGVVQRVQLGLQEGFRSNLWQLSGSVTGLFGVVLVTRYRGGLPYLVLALAGAPALAMLANCIVYFARVRPELRPLPAQVGTLAMREIAYTGSLFFVLQLAVAIAYSADSLIIARTLGPEAVARYAVTARLFSMVSLILAMFLGPLWPAYGEAISRGDLSWVKNTLLRSILASVTVAFAASTFLVLFAPVLLKVWLHRAIEPTFLLLLGLGLWTVIDAAGVSVAMFLNGANIVKMQVMIASVFAVACLLLKIVLVNRFGVAGIPWATVTSYLLLSAIPCAVLVPRILRRLTSVD